MASSPAVAMASFSASLVSCWAGVFVFSWVSLCLIWRLIPFFFGCNDFAFCCEADFWRWISRSFSFL